MYVLLNVDDISSQDTGVGGDSSSQQVSVVVSDVIDTHQVYRVELSYIPLIQSHVSGQSVEVTPRADEESKGETGQDADDEVGGRPHCWPETDVPGLHANFSTILGPRCYNCRPLHVRFVEGDSNEISEEEELQHIGVINLIKNSSVIMDCGHDKF